MRVPTTSVQDRETVPVGDRGKSGARSVEAPDILYGHPYDTPTPSLGGVWGGMGVSQSPGIKVDAPQPRLDSGKGP